MTIVLGIDPGGAATGLVLRDGARVAGHDVVERRKLTEVAYLSEVTRSVVGMAGHAELVAVEGLVAPVAYINGKKQLLHPESFMGVCTAFGWVMCVLSVVLDLEPVVVRPNGHGSRHEALGVDVRRLYPAALIGPREGPAGTGILRHARSAWDIAGAARPIRPDSA